MKTVTFWYHLQIRFDEPVTNHRFTVRSFPCTDERQEILMVRQELVPNHFLVEGVDSFGNRYVYGDAVAPHELFDVQVRGKARLGLCAWTEAKDIHQVGIYRTASSLTRSGEQLSRLGASLDFSSCQGNLQKAEVIMRAVAAQKQSVWVKVEEVT